MKPTAMSSGNPKLMCVPRHMGTGRSSTNPMMATQCQLNDLLGGKVASLPRQQENQPHESGHDHSHLKSHEADPSPPTGRFLTRAGRGVPPGDPHECDANDEAPAV